MALAALEEAFHRSVWHVRRVLCGGDGSSRSCAATGVGARGPLHKSISVVPNLSHLVPAMSSPSTTETDMAMWSLTLRVLCVRSVCALCFAVRASPHIDGSHAAHGAGLF